MNPKAREAFIGRERFIETVSSRREAAINAISRKFDEMMDDIKYVDVDDKTFMIKASLNILSCEELS